MNQIDDQIYADSGATSHIINNLGKLKSIVPYKGHDKIFAGNGQGLQISHIGNASLKTDYGDLHLKNVLVVPKIKKNLLSVGQLANDSQCSFVFNSDGFFVKNKQN